MKEILKFFSENSSSIQAISSVVSIIIIFFTAIFTFVYVRLTSNLVNIPYKSYLRPMKLEWKDKISSFCVKLSNYGPGLSSMTRVSAYTSVQIKKENNKNDIFFFKKMVIAVGPDEIKSNEEKTFIINGFFIENCYLIIEYKSLSGKKYKTLWMCKGYKPEEITQVTFIGKIKFFVARLIDFIFLPYTTYKKWSFLEYRYTCNMLLMRLNTLGELDYSELADICVKSDEIIKTILEKMRKKGYVSYGERPFHYRITEKGFNRLKYNEIFGKVYYDDENNRIKYDGMFKCGKFHGKGTLYSEFKHQLYSGDWIEGKRNGKGISYNRVNGQLIYEGDWENDLMDGFGKLYDENGNVVYEGEFSEGSQKI